MNFCIKFDTKTIMSTFQNQINYDTLPPEIHDRIWKIVHGLNMYDVKKELKDAPLYRWLWRYRMADPDPSWVLPGSGPAIRYRHKNTV